MQFPFYSLKSFARAFIALSALAAMTADRAGGQPAKAKPVSYHRQIWPILQAKCQACHQPASPGGKLILTTYADFAKGGEHGVSYVAGKPGTSGLLDYLTGKKTLMPKGGPPLPDRDIALFRRWIAEGAKDDTPAVKDAIDAAHPPVYTAPPVITSLAYAPDGSVLAVSGYREVLLHRSDGSGLVARLVGQSQVISTVAFSPDGKTLAAVGGSPARFGEIQFWNVETRRSIQARKVGYDTLFGAALSPDGAQLAFGGSDNAVRVVSVPEGKPVMQLDNHSDWVFATAFALDSKHVLSTGRDQAIKLTEVKTGSFIDDINTHTNPLRCLARNPKENQVLCGGEDGIPRLYQIFRTKARTMNQEDHNLLRAFDRQPGPITALAFSADGAQMAVGSEAEVVNVYSVADGKQIATLRGFQGVIYTVTFRPDGKQIAAGGFDGKVHLFDLPSGREAKAFVPVPLGRPKNAPVPAALTK